MARLVAVPPKHICEQEHSLLLIDAGNGSLYLLTRLIDIIVPADRDSSDMVYLTHYHLSSSQQLNSQPAMSNNHPSNQRHINLTKVEKIFVTFVSLWFS
jgi:hypothetical protein